MPRLTVAHAMDEEAHTLVVCRVEPEHAGKNVIGFFEPAEPAKSFILTNLQAVQK